MSPEPRRPSPTQVAEVQYRLEAVLERLRGGTSSRPVPDAEIAQALRAWVAAGGTVQLTRPEVAPDTSWLARLCQDVAGCPSSGGGRAMWARTAAASLNLLSAAPRSLRVRHLEWVVAEIRDAQIELGHHPDLEVAISEISLHLRRYRPGYVHGLSRTHRPRFGSWAGDSQYHRKRLGFCEPYVTAEGLPSVDESLATLQHSVQSGAPVAQIQALLLQLLFLQVATDDPRLLDVCKDATSALNRPEFSRVRYHVRRVAREALADRSWSFSYATVGKRALLAGIRDRVADAWAPMGFRSLAPLRQPFDGAAVRDRLASGIDLVFAQREFLSEEESELLRASCNLHGAPLVWVENPLELGHVQQQIARSLKGPTNTPSAQDVETAELR